MPAYDRNSWHSVVLDCFHIMNDGKVYGASFERFEVSFFPGQKEIQMLRPYPFRYAPSRLQESCWTIGKRFLDMTASSQERKPSPFRYVGRTLTRLPDGSSMDENGQVLRSEYDKKYFKPGKAEDIDEEVIVDLDATFLVCFLFL